MFPSENCSIWCLVLLKVTWKLSIQFSFDLKQLAFFRAHFIVVPHNVFTLTFYMAWTLQMRLLHLCACELPDWLWQMSHRVWNGIRALVMALIVITACPQGFAYNACQFEQLKLNSLILQINPNCRSGFVTKWQRVELNYYRSLYCFVPWRVTACGC